MDEVSEGVVSFAVAVSRADAGDELATMEVASEIAVGGETPSTG